MLTMSWPKFKHKKTRPLRAMGIELPAGVPVGADRQLALVLS
jgi:hypothetical protein